MKVKWNKLTNLPEVEFEKSDFAAATSVKQMLNGEFACKKCGTKTEINAWTVLEGYFASMRLSIEEIGKSHARNRAKKDLCSNDFSILDGFDIAVGMPKKIVLQAEMLRDLKKKEEVTNESQSDDY